MRQWSVAARSRSDRRGAHDSCAGSSQNISGTSNAIEREMSRKPGRQGSAQPPAKIDSRGQPAYSNPLGRVLAHATQTGVPSVASLTTCFHHALPSSRTRNRSCRSGIAEFHTFESLACAFACLKSAHGGAGDASGDVHREQGGRRFAGVQLPHGLTLVCMWGLVFGRTEGLDPKGERKAIRCHALNERNPGRIPPSVIA